MKKLLISAAFVALGLTPAMAQDCATPVPTVEPGKLTVAIYDYPPFNIVGADGSVSGIDPSIAEAVAKDNCLEFVAAVMDPAATVQAVIAGKADIAIGSWNRTVKRSEVLGIGAPTYLDPMGILSKDGTDTIEGMIGKKVGTVTGYLWVEQMQALLGDNLSLYPTAVALAQDLAAGRIDVAADGYNYAAYAQKNAGAYEGIQIKLAQPDERISASVKAPQAGFLYTKGNDTLGAAIDATVERLKAEGIIGKAIVDAGYDPRVAETGEAWLVE
ncbi:MAG: amino acid ABC transporter substrate-binding protein [Rhodobacteraceae bacterium]|jgi:polar amino acid transport system substrate-binding protein|nr:amino acid ABC transporter substrate-binding protein [Paracoccaceae bacterium]